MKAACTQHPKTCCEILKLHQLKAFSYLQVFFKLNESIFQDIYWTVAPQKSARFGFMVLFWIWDLTSVKYCNCLSYPPVIEAIPKLMAVSYPIFVLLLTSKIINVHVILPIALVQSCSIDVERLFKMDMQYINGSHLSLTSLLSLRKNMSEALMLQEERYSLNSNKKQSSIRSKLRLKRPTEAECLYTICFLIYTHHSLE